MAANHNPSPTTTNTERDKVTSLPLPEGVGDLLFLDDAHFPNDRAVRLKLYTEKRSRELGVIRKAEREFCTERLSHHLLRVGNSLAFCYHLIANAKTFDTIRLSWKNKIYLLPREILLREGKNDVKFFKKEGFETQINVSLSLIEQYEMGKTPPAEPVTVPTPIKSAKQPLLFD